MKIISIDPGYGRCGVAILERKNKKDTLIFSTCLETNPKKTFNDRLGFIGGELEVIIKKYKPDFLATETLFFNTNQKTAMNVSQVRGVIVYLAKKSGLGVFEYTPLQIKVAVTGYGRSDKRQVISMIPKLISVSGEIKHDDEWDAIAVGLTCLASEKLS